LACRVVTFCKFLEFDEDTGDTAKTVGQVEVLAEVGVRSIGMGLGEKEEFGEPGGGELEADLGKSGRVFSAEVEESVLLEPGSVDALLCIEPVLVTTSIPIGDIARGNTDAEFVQSGNDLAVGGAVFEHVVDKVAVGLGEGSDFAVTFAI